MMKGHHFIRRALVTGILALVLVALALVLIASPAGLTHVGSPLAAASHPIAPATMPMTTSMPGARLTAIDFRTTRVGSVGGALLGRWWPHVAPDHTASQPASRDGAADWLCERRRMGANTPVRSVHLCSGTSLTSAVLRVERATCCTAARTADAAGERWPRIKAL